MTDAAPESQSGPGGGERAHRAADLARWALVATAVAPLAWWPGAAFPFVTTRVTLFRLLVGAALLLWLAARAGRPRLLSAEAGRAWNPAGVAIAVFLLAAGVSAAASVAPVRSAFGNLARMGGVLAWLYYAAYFLALCALFDARWWRRWLAAVAAVAGVSALVAVGQGLALLELPLTPTTGAGAAALTGNSGFAGAHLLLGAGAAGLLAATGRGRARAGWAAAAALCLAGLGATQARAALAGGMLGGLVAAAGIADERLELELGRDWAFVALFLAAAGLGTVYWLRQPGPALPVLEGVERLAETSLRGESLQQRLVGWEAAVAGFRAHPLFGVGLENFGVVFDRWAGGEIFEISSGGFHLDRAHNAFLGHLATTGIAGGLAYAAIYAAAGWGAWRRRGSGLLGGGASGRTAPWILLGLVVAYAVHQLFWFEDPNSFPVFLGLAALAATGGGASSPASGRGGEKGEGSAGRPAPGAWGHRLLLLGAGAAVLLGAAYQAATYRVALRLGGAGSDAFAERVGAHRSALSARTPSTPEAVTAYAEYLVRLRSRVGKIRGSQRARSMLTRSVEEALAATGSLIDRDPARAYYRALEGELLLTAYEVLERPQLLERAAGSFRAASERAPGKITVLHSLARVQLERGRPAEARRALERARAVYGEHPRTYRLLARVHLAGGRPVRAYAALRQAFEARSRILYSRDDPVVRELRRELEAAGRGELAAGLDRMVVGAR